MMNEASMVEAAWSAIAVRDKDAAMAHAKEAHRLAPQSTKVQHLLGLLASRDGQHELGLQLLQAAINAGEKNPRLLRDMAEALFAAGYAEQALQPLNESINTYGENTPALGLKSAILIDLEQWPAAQATAEKANQLDQHSLAWYLNASFAALAQKNYRLGFEYATARQENFSEYSRCPVFNLNKPFEVWLKSEQGFGDTLFFLRYVQSLKKLGWKFHLEVEKKLAPLLKETSLFESVFAANPCPEGAFWMSVGDLPLAAMQCGINTIPSPLTLQPNLKLVDKYTKQLAEFGPPPYIAVTWRAGPQNATSSKGIRLLDKSIPPHLLGTLLAKTNATIVNLQREPNDEDFKVFNEALGRPSADYTKLNNNLSGMLAMLSIVDHYIGVSNTNIHLREGLNKQSEVLVNHPAQDWRWLCEGDGSVWYPSSRVYRQSNEKAWQPALDSLEKTLFPIVQKTIEAARDERKEGSVTLATDTIESDRLTVEALLDEGWNMVTHNIPFAIKNAQQVLSLQPDNPNALHLLGWAAMQDLKFELGLSVLENAVNLAPNNGNIWRDYIRAWALVGEPQKAIDIGVDCLNSPKVWAKGVVHYAIGSAYLMIDDDLKALEQFECCLSLIPHHLDAAGAAGLVRMRLGDGYAGLGLKLNSARSEARAPQFAPYWVCPVLRGEVKGLTVLIVRSMGFGDELSYLRYLPYLLEAGVKVTYWCGVKLVPLLARLPYALTLIPDTEPMPDPADYDLTFIKNELPMAAEHLGSPEIADPLPLKADEKKIEKWRSWLKEQGNGPYIGITWRAGVGGNVKDGFGYTRLSKKVEQADLAKALSGINATWVSLQRNITKQELTAFEQLLGNPIIDVAGITDDLDDLLCIQLLLDENIGVSNTNMHLRASLGLGSKVLVSIASRDWRWGVDGQYSTWFKQSKVYRESKENGWQTSLTVLRDDLIQQYGLMPINNNLDKKVQVEATELSKRIIWVTAGEIKKQDTGFYSPLSSAQERVINVAELLTTKGWRSDYLIESVSELMGGWHDKLPVAGDIVVFSKVFTDHAITLMHDAKARGAKVVLDVFNDFSNQPKRDLHQKKMIEAADAVVSTPDLKAKWQAVYQDIQVYFENITDQTPKHIKVACLEDWQQLFVKLESGEFAHTDKQELVEEDLPQAESVSNQPVSTQLPTKRIIWIAAGEVSINDQGIDSPLASTRYRVLIPAANLGPLGWQSQVVNERDLVSSGWGDFSIHPGDILVVSKVFNLNLISYIERAKQKGCRLIVDFCDYHFDRQDDLGNLHNKLLVLADLVTTCSTELQQLIQAKTQAPVRFITDSFESNKAVPSVTTHDPLKLVWFGSPTNLDTLTTFLKALADFAIQQPVIFDVVTHFDQGHLFAQHYSTDHLTVNYIPWSLTAQQHAIQSADLVVIPTVEAQVKNVKSPNRIVEAIWQGKFVIAGKLPAYEPFSAFAAITDDYIDALEWFIANQAKALEKVKAGQAYIEKHHTPKKIGEFWQSAINDVFEVDSKISSTGPGEIKPNPIHQYIQAKEVARLFLNSAVVDQHKAQDFFDLKYPVQTEIKTPKIAVYTAIFGGYDTAPILKYSEPDVDYILYTDQSDFDAPSPWQVRVVPAIFMDPQVDARRVKVLSHQFLPDYDITVWIDGNFTLGKLTTDLVKDIAKRAPVALCRHQFRNCIYDEAEEILRRKIDAATPVVKQMQYYQARQFPKGFGLHATGFLVRNHQDSQVIKMNMRWWELLSTNSKRDQLTFDYVRWELNIPMMPMPFNQRENSLFEWGKNGNRNHKSSIRRSDEHNGRSFRSNKSNTIVITAYESSHDEWPPQFLKDLFELNKFIIQKRLATANSIYYLDQDITHANTLPDPRLGYVRSELIAKLALVKRVLQFDIDPGYMALLTIHFSSASFCFVNHANTNAYNSNEALQFLKRLYPERINEITSDKLTDVREAPFDLIVYSERERASWFAQDNSFVFSFKDYGFLDDLEG